MMVEIIYFSLAFCCAILLLFLYKESLVLQLKLTEGQMALVAALLIIESS